MWFDERQKESCFLLKWDPPQYVLYVHFYGPARDFDKKGCSDCVYRTHILDAIDKMNGEPVPVDDGLFEEPDDWIVHDTENDLATCPETHGYETLMNLGRDQSAHVRSAQLRDTCFDSSSRETDITFDVT